MIARLAAAAAGAAVACAATRSHGPAGLWQGRIQGVLRIVVHVAADSSGAWTSTLDSPDQGASGIPVTSTTFEHDTLRLELPNLGAAYAGHMNAAGDRVEGEWRQSGQVMSLALARADSIPAERRPQEPRRPYPYIEEDVSYPGGAPDVTLAGTLTRPNGPGPFPCALLITGSGPEDRDEKVFGHRPFLVIADHLTRAGIAVLRVDDRGVGQSTGSAAGATSEDFAADVLAGVRYLKTRSVIDSARVGLIGHSEGGLIAPMAATRSPAIAFIVMLAGPGVPGEQILYAQGEAIAMAMGKSKDEVAQQRRIQERLFAVVKADLDSATAATRIRRIFHDEQPDSAAAEAQARSSIQLARSPWFRYFLTYDPRPTLGRVRCPVLALNGAKDAQVPPQQNLPEIAKALKAGGNHDVTTRELPGLNHLFQTCTTGAPTEYSKIEETMAPAALDAMTEWIRAHTTRAH